jgi:2-epi-5-epi-valiolone synthase
MAERRHDIVVVEHSDGGRWIVHARGLTESYLEAGDSTDEPFLVDFASRLVVEHGGVEVRCLVFIADSPQAFEPRCVAVYPRRIYALTPRMALAHAVSSDASRFIVIDAADEVSASSFVRISSGLVEQPLRLDVGTASEAIAALGVHRVAICESESQSARALIAQLGHCGTLEILPRDAHVSGALAFGASLVDHDGVWLPSRAISRINATQQIGYSIQRTTRPVFDRSEATLREVVDERPVLLVIDNQVDALYGHEIRDYASDELDTRGYVTVAALESNKSWHEVERICRGASDGRLDRRGIVIGVGGGVTLDIAGLAAAVFRRGLGYVRVPTTLVGLCDVSLGVKQGVNAFGRKSILGAFYPPLASINDYTFLRTLPSSQIACGLAEVIKIALVRDARLFEDVQRNGELFVAHSALCTGAIARDIWYRAECLMLEELCNNLDESNLARLVDFGHTFSPTVEANGGYQIAHGQAVAFDMLLSTAIAVEQGICAPRLFQDLAKLLQTLGLTSWESEPIDVDMLQAALASSREHRAGRLNLVVPIKEGVATFIQTVTADSIRNALESMRAFVSDWRLVGAGEGAA